MFKQLYTKGTQFLTKCYLSATIWRKGGLILGFTLHARVCVLWDHFRIECDLENSQKCVFTEFYLQEIHILARVLKREDSVFPTHAEFTFLDARIQ